MSDHLSPTVLDMIGARRSIRRYTARLVEPDLIERVVQAALQAPSAHNRQPWRFAVAASADARLRLAQALGDRLRADRLADGDAALVVEADVSRSRARIVQAPVVIVACLSMLDMDTYPDARRAQAERVMAQQSLAAAIENLLLAAHGVGLAGCWMCAPLFAPEAARQALDLPDDWEPQALITLGYPSGEPKPKTIQPMETKVVYR